MSSEISNDERTPTRVQSVARASRLLLLVAGRPGGLSAAEAATAAGLAVPTAHHLLNTLCDEGLLVRDSRRHFVLGPRVAVLADAYLRDGVAPEFLTAPLESLAAETGETAYLTTWREGEIHALASVEGTGALRVAAVERGRYRSAHARATGKLLLAFARPELRDAVLGAAQLEQVTPRTTTDRAALEDELDAIRERGWSSDRDEFAEGVSCVSAPALIDDVVIATYTLSVPSASFERRFDDLLIAVQRAARAAAGAIPDPPEHQ